MTATRKAPARRPRPRPELRMPYLYCVKPDCTYEYQPVGDYRDTWLAAEADGWEYHFIDGRGYFIGEGWLCPGHKDYVPWWPQPAGRLALPAPDVPAQAAEKSGSDLTTAQGPDHEEHLVNVPRPGPTVSAVEGAMPVNAPGPGDFQVLPTVRVGGVHLTLDPEPLPTMDDVAPIDGWGCYPSCVPGCTRHRPDATVSFAVTGETQPFDRYAALRPENLHPGDGDAP